MRFLVFSDFHYEPGVFLCTGLEGIRAMQERAVKEGCDFILQLGDLCHGGAEDGVLLQTLHDCALPVYHALGNHDAEHRSFSDTVALYGMPHSYYFFDRDGYRMIVLDPNYYLDGEAYVHFELRNWMAHGAARDHVPPEQLAWLARTIDESPDPCILLSHQSFERPDGVKNRAAVREIIEAANKKRAHSVVMCINGHYHRDHVGVIDGVCYFDLNSASADWVSKPHFSFPEELHARVRKLKHLVVFETPLSAVVTLSDGKIEIRGSSAEMLCGVDYKVATGGDGRDCCGRPFTQSISDAEIIL